MRVLLEVILGKLVKQQAAVSQDLPKLASSKKKILRGIVLFLSLLGGLLVAENVNSASPTHRKGNSHLLSTYYVPECDSGQKYSFKWKTVELGVLRQP